MDVSVCMATYNGEKFINDQLNSILSQIDRNDELIIIDDCSKDNTVKIIESYNDKRIKIFRNETNKGHVYSFNRAISLALNEFIFLSDQDDIWIPGRVSIMKKKLAESNAMVVSSNFDLISTNGEIKKSNYFLYKKDSTKYLKNIVGIFMGKRGYFGCAMAFHKNLLKYILPIPYYVEAHDLWIAIASNILKSNIHIEDISVRRKIHGNNVSSLNEKRNILLKIKARFIFLFSILEILLRKNKINKKQQVH